MLVLADNTPEALSWLESRIDFKLGPGTRLIAAVNADGQYAGLIGFGGRMGRTIGSISIAVDDELAMLPLVRAGAIYLFSQLGMVAAYIAIGSKRENWLAKLKEVIGFEEIDRVPDGIASGEDLVIMRLSASACRPWLAYCRKQRPTFAEVA